MSAERGANAALTLADGPSPIVKISPSNQLTALTAPRSGSGLGIGLALVRAIVQSHAGSVTAFSAGLGQGCEFTVCLPLEK